MQDEECFGEFGQGVWGEEVILGLRVLFSWEIPLKVKWMYFSPYVVGYLYRSHFWKKRSDCVEKRWGRYLPSGGYFWEGGRKRMVAYDGWEDPG